MATPERRRDRAHTVELVAGTPAGAIATAVAAEKARDQFKGENPTKFRRVVGRTPAGPLRRTVDVGLVRSSAVLASAGLGGVAYGAQRYQQASLERESRRDKARAKAAHVREQIGPKGAGMGPLQELAKASERDKKDTRNAAVAGAGGAAYAARRSQQAATKATHTADSLRRVRNASALATAAGTAVGTPSRQSLLSHLADRPFHAAATKAREAVKDVPGNPGPAPKPPTAGTDTFEGAEAHHKFLRDADAHIKAVREHGGRLEDARRAAGRQAKLKVGSGMLHSHWLKVGVPGGSTVGAEVGRRAAVRSAAKHTRAMHTRAGAAVGLLGVAAAAQRSRRQPRRVTYY